MLPIRKVAKMSSFNPQKKKTYPVSENPVEQLKDTAVGAVREIGQVPKDLFSEALSQIGLKSPRKPMSGEFNLKDGSSQNPAQVERTDKKDVSLEAKMRQLQYLQRNEKEVFNKSSRQEEARIAELKAEIVKEAKKLEQQTTELNKEIKQMSVDSKKAEKGLYYTNLYLMILAMIRDMGKKVGESRMWLSISMNKKKQKGYWAQFKKKGTSFAMSEERSIATANG